MSARRKSPPWEGFPEIRYPIIDTHAHLFKEEFEEGIDRVVERAQAAGVRHVLIPNLDCSTLPDLLDTCRRYPHWARPMIGLHPSYVGADYREQLSSLRTEVERHRAELVAVGEIGIDYHWSLEYREQMHEAFREQLMWAAEYDLPVSVHSRDAVVQVIEEIEQVGAERLRGVIHSFTGSAEELRRVLSLPHFLVGVVGIVTYSNAHLAELFGETLPLERVVVETDSPYLSPVPYRGHRNEPANVTYTLACLARIYQLPIETIAAQVFDNSIKMFNLAI